MERHTRLQPLARAVLRAQPDRRLVALAREGREPAFEEIVRRYRQPLVAFAAAYAPPASAEDVVQESLAAAWRAMEASPGEIRLKPWLYTIVRNRALNARRDARPAEPLPDDVGGVHELHEVVLTREELNRVVAAINALPEMQRAALVRSAVEGRTLDQIAGELGSSPGAVGQLVFRARAALRSGVGMLVPLPLLRGLLEPAGELAAGAAAVGGAAAASGGGGSVLVKGAAVAAVGLAAASGVAIERGEVVLERCRRELRAERELGTRRRELRSERELRSGIGRGRLWARRLLERTRRRRRLGLRGDRLR